MAVNANVGTRWGFVCLAYAFLILGMAAHGAFHHFTGAVPWTWNAFFAPVVISPMVFSGFLSIIKSDIDLLTGGLIAFQNGFFWKQIFDGLKPVLNAHGAGS